MTDNKLYEASTTTVADQCYGTLRMAFNHYYEMLKQKYPLKRSEDIKGMMKTAVIVAFEATCAAYDPAND